MKRILLYISDGNGCTLHRLILPHAYLNKEVFEVQYGTESMDYEEIGKYDLFVFHRMLPDGMIERLKAECPNTKIICDIDDLWELTTSHILYNHYLNYDISNAIKKHIKLADYVTTTTPLLAAKIKPFNPNVHVFANSLIPDSEFKPNPTPSDKIRFGIIGGCTHVKDMVLLEGVVKQLPQDVLDKIQFVLGGFDKGVYQIPMADGSIRKEPMPWEENAWVKMERILTNDYQTISPEHKQFLQQYTMGLEFNSDEPYKRIWAKDIWNYATIYDDIDVLLVPLVDNEFNRSKSELKLIEAGVKQKACIVSDVMPYKLCAIPAIEKGGAINPEGNCLMVNNAKGSRGWAKAITRLVKDKDLRDMITTNLTKLTEPGAKYNLKKVTDDRNNFYKKILNYEEPILST